MDGKVVVKFGMECRYQLIALFGGNDVPVNLCQHFHFASHLIYIGRTYKGHWHGMVYALKIAFNKEAAQLTSVSITTHGGVHRRNALLVVAFHMFGQ